jgi:glycosyltransferase involved in cell wall biosynthesis
VGRLVAHKHAGRLLPLAGRLRGHGLTIDVVGRGPDAGPLADSVAAAGLGDVLRLRGYLPDGDKRATVAGALLHLSTSQGEGWGLCVLEAAALGVPTVAYDVDGLRDAVRDGETGWLVRAGEHLEDVTERAVKELADPRRRAEMAAACRSWAAQLTWPGAVDRMAALVAASARAGTAQCRHEQGRHGQAWVVKGRGGRVLAEGPVLDELLRRDPAAALIRPATAAERLAGRPDGPP